MRFKRKGRAARDYDGSLILINEESEPFKVDEIYAYVWYICDKKNEEEIVKEFYNENVDKEYVRKEINFIISRLKQAELIEIIEE